MNLLKKLFREEEGLETVEYAVMGGLILTALITAIALLSGAVSGKFTDLANTITGP